MPTQTTKESYTRSVTPGAPSAIEDQLLQLAMASFQDIFSSLSEGGDAGINFASASRPSVSPALLKLVQQIQEQTGAQARRGVTETFGELQRGIAGDLANRGALNTSALGERNVQLATTLGNRVADIEGQASSTAAGQAFQGAFQGQANQIQLLQMLQSLKLAASNPALLSQLMNFRLNTATQSGSSTSRTTTPFDPTALLAAGGTAAGALFPGGILAKAAVGAVG